MYNEPAQISDRISLLDAQRSAVSPVATEKKSAQIGHLGADKSGQFLGTRPRTS